MAKLSARGRKRIFHLVRDLENSDDFYERRSFIAIMSDGSILHRATARYRQIDLFEIGRLSGKLHAWPWRILVTAAQGKKRSADQWLQYYTDRGYSLKK